jgi:hypothetical protein
VRPPSSDERWREIRAAAPRKPSARARTEIEQALAEFAFNREVFASKIEGERASEKEIIDLAGKLKTALYRRRRQAPWPEDDPELPLRELQAVTSISWRHQDILGELRRRDPALGVLLRRLLDIWVDHFGGTLTVSDPPGGGAPGCKLVRFVQAATRGVLRPPISPHTIRAYTRKPNKPKPKTRKPKRVRRAKGILPPAK